MGSEPGYPFQGEIYFSEEASYGGGFSGPTSAISDKVLDVRIGSGDVHKTLRGISEPSVCAFIATGGDMTLHVEWVYQPHTGVSFASDCVRRTNGDIPSLAIEIGASTERTTESWFLLTGCKCKTFNISASRGEEYICTADFSVQSVATSTAATEVQPTALGTSYAGFNVAGDITFTGGYTAYITDSIDITVDNNLTDYYNVGSSTKLAAIPGALDITGSADLSLDEGGAVAWGHVTGLSSISTLVVNTGLTTGGAGKITLTNGRYDNLDIDINLDSNAMMSSIPFTFKKIGFSAGT